MQRIPPSSFVCYVIYICSFRNRMFGSFNVSAFGSLNQRTICMPTPHQQHSRDCCE